MISWRHVTKWTRYVPHEQAEDYCRLGWCIADAFEETPHAHAFYCAMCAWLCECKPIEPESSAMPTSRTRTFGRTGGA
jgi:hypothetical protein